MGMGEPLNNTDRVFEAVRLLNDPERLGIGARHITVSTSGVVPGIDRMIDELPQVNLAISLHAADDDAARRAGADQPQVADRACSWPPAVASPRAPRRRVSLEYVMIDGVNDAPGAGRAAWRRWPRLAQPRQPHPAEPDARLALERHAAGRRRRLRRRRCSAAGVPVTVRDTRGREIEAACGQLHAQLAGRDLPTAPTRRGREPQVVAA